MKKYIMTVDEGTTGIRAVAFDHETNIVSRVYEEISQFFPYLGWCEQDGMRVWKKCKQVMKGAVKNVGITADKIENIDIPSQRATSSHIWDGREQLIDLLCGEITDRW